MCACTANCFFPIIRVCINSIEYILLRHVKRSVYTVAFICMTKTSTSSSSHTHKTHTRTSKEFYGDSTRLYMDWILTHNHINHLLEYVRVSVRHCRSVKFLHIQVFVSSCVCVSVYHTHSEIFGGILLFDLKMYNVISFFEQWVRSMAQFSFYCVHSERKNWFSIRLQLIQFVCMNG